MSEKSTFVFKMRPTILWLIFLSIVIQLSFVYHPQAAIPQQRDHPNSDLDPSLDQDEDTNVDQDSQTIEPLVNKILDISTKNNNNKNIFDHHNTNFKTHLGELKAFSVEQQQQQQYLDEKDYFDSNQSKFILLTTGDQIKLYPIKLAPNEEQEGLITSDSIDNNNYYIIKPTEFNVSNSKLLEYLSDSSYEKWLISKSKQNLYLATGKTPSRITKASIIPDTSEIDAPDDIYENNHPSGWKKPFIIDVDYFVDENYCDNGSSKFCLVVIWLDKSNKLVRYGSIDLLEALKSFKSKEAGLSKSNVKENILWLNEFPSIQVYKTISDDTNCNQYPCHIDGVQLSSMVVDKHRKVLHVAFSDGIQSFKRPNKILTGTLKTWTQIFDRSDHKQLVSQRVLSFNKYSPPSEIDENNGLQNLNVDELTGDWLFYFDSTEAGKVFALNIDDQWSSKRGLVDAKEAIQSLAVDNTMSNTNLSNQDSENKSSINFAFDQKNRRIFLINDANEILSCGISGEDVELVGKLSQKPAIRSSFSMQVFENMLLISDSIKKSLIGISLDKYNRKLRDVNKQKSQNEFGITHQVLLVQMTSLYGFRVVEREPTTANDLQQLAREANLNLINLITLDINDPSKVVDYTLIPKFLDTYTTAYDDLIGRSSLFYPESIDRWRKHVERQYLKQVLGTIGLATCYISLILLLIGIYLIRKRRKRDQAKQDDLRKLQLDMNIQPNDTK